MKMIRSLLIANRGEIACRIMRTCRQLGIRTVAVYATVDAAARHVRLADEAVCLEGATAADSYLAIDKIIAAARQTGVDAVHPGFGFLAENAVFARACAEAGLIFVGPPPEAIEVMGNKLRARKVAVAAGVPVVPGYDGEAQTDEALLAAADALGFPVMV
ncbi:MAG: hypothetical protein D6706_07940, partial [Chloroflexi bacterium]